MAEPDLTVRPIGVVRTGHDDPATTPVQANLNHGEQGRVELSAGFGDGLWGLDGFDFAWLLTWLGPIGAPVPPVALRQVPFLLTAQQREIGLFAMRGPRRPNPIGLHLVRILEVTGTGFTFSGVDMVDGTPLLDLKPWAAPFDLPPGATAPDLRNGWLDEADTSGPHTPRSLRPPPAP